jgi:hypothetical protein
MALCPGCTTQSPVGPGVPFTNVTAPTTFGDSGFTINGLAWAITSGTSPLQPTFTQQNNSWSGAYTAMSTVLSPKATIRSYENLCRTAGEYAAAGARQRAADDWQLTGVLSS